MTDLFLSLDISECSSNPCQNGGTCTEAPPEWSVLNDPAFSLKPRCAKIDRTQHCSCDAGFHMSGTSDNSICQGTRKRGHRELEVPCRVIITGAGASPDKNLTDSKSRSGYLVAMIDLFLSLDISECSSNPCQNGGTCTEGMNHYRCSCQQNWSGSHCQHQVLTAPPEWSVLNDPAFSLKPRCAKIDRTQHCSCDAGFHMSGTSDNSICQGTRKRGHRELEVPCRVIITGAGASPDKNLTAPPEWSVLNDPAFSRKPRCAKIDRTQHCSCDAGFHMSGTSDNSICQDVNECEVYKLEGAPRLCMHACVNIPGSYRCSCPAGYKLLGDGRSCEDIDECLALQHNCTRGTTCINTGEGFQCVNPECPKAHGNVSYVKTSPFQCERNPCPMDSRSCHLAPKTVSFHYLSLPSNLKTPLTLFRMATAAAPGRPGPDSLRFGIVGGNSKGHFVMQRSDRQTGELILVQSLRGPQSIEVDMDMSEYLDRMFQAKHVSKVTVFVSPNEF
ncbi:UNVERIFIED_CONTAM: hypothetical protein FKN15_031736 [Acipenser sinensis]